MSTSSSCTPARGPQADVVRRDPRRSLDDLIGEVQDGVLIDGRGSYSIDQQHLQQFGNDAFWEIKNGKKTRMLADVAYQSKTQDFWNACAAIADKGQWRNFGLTNDGGEQRPERRTP